MENSRHVNRTCRYCGKTRTVTIKSNSNADGIVRDTVLDSGCDCLFGKFDHAINQLGCDPVQVFNINPACRNCAHNVYDYCTCDQMKAKLRETFDIGDLPIRDDSHKCEFYEFNTKLIMDLMTNKTNKEAR